MKKVTLRLFVTVLAPETLLKFCSRFYGEAELAGLREVLDESKPSPVKKGNVLRGVIEKDDEKAGTIYSILNIMNRISAVGKNTEIVDALCRDRGVSVKSQELLDVLFELYLDHYDLWKVCPVLCDMQEFSDTQTYMFSPNCGSEIDDRSEETIAKTEQRIASRVSQLHIYGKYAKLAVETLGLTDHCTLWLSDMPASDMQCSLDGQFAIKATENTRKMVLIYDRTSNLLAMKCRNIDSKTRLLIADAWSYYFLQGCVEKELKKMPCSLDAFKDGDLPNISITGISRVEFEVVTYSPGAGLPFVSIVAGQQRPITPYNLKDLCSGAFHDESCELTKITLAAYLEEPIYGVSKFLIKISPKGYSLDCPRRATTDIKESANRILRAYHVCECR